MLEGLGYTVIVAASMANALRAAARSGCDVLISDIGLPDGDGWELLNRLNLPRPMYAIAMSGYGTVSDRNRSKAAGYRHHLVKPMELEQLESILSCAAEELHRSEQPTSEAQRVSRVQKQARLNSRSYRLRRGLRWRGSTLVDFCPA